MMGRFIFLVGSYAYNIACVCVCTLMGWWRSVGRDASSSTASRRWRMASRSVMGSSKFERRSRLPAAVWHEFRAESRDGPPVGFKLLTTSSRLAVSESKTRPVTESNIHTTRTSKRFLEIFLKIKNNNNKWHNVTNKEMPFAQSRDIKTLCLAFNRTTGSTPR